MRASSKPAGARATTTATRRHSACTPYRVAVRCRRRRELIFAKPSYQSASPATGRAVPDVAALGDPQTGLLVGQTQTFPDGAYYDEYRIGGTSLSSPIFAGLMALADQKAGHAHGFANPLFYANPGCFYDVLSVKTAVARRNFINSVDARWHRGPPAHIRRLFRLTDAAHGSGLGQRDGAGHAQRFVLEPALAG